MPTTKRNGNKLAANLYESAIMYLTLAEKRLKVLPILIVEKDFDDVVRQVYDIYGFCLVGLINFARVETQESKDLDVLIRVMEENLSEMPPTLRKGFRRLREMTQKVVEKRKKVVDLCEVPRPRPNSILAREEAVFSMRWGNRVVKLAQQVIKDYDD